LHSLDGTDLDSVSAFLPVSGSNSSLYYATIRLTSSGAHRFYTSNGAPLGAVAYGYNSCDAYSYMASTSPIFNGGPKPIPNAPSNVGAQVVQPSTLSNGYTVQVSWTDNATNEEGFFVQRRAQDESVWTLLGHADADATSFVDGSSLRDKVYEYRVCSYSDLSSGWAYSTVAVDTPPVEPQDLSANSSNQGEVDLSWQDASTVETGYVIQRSLASSDPDVPGSWTTRQTLEAHAGTGAMSWTDTGVASQTDYRYRIKAVHGDVHTASDIVLTSHASILPSSTELALGRTKAGQLSATSGRGLCAMILGA
jgi:hypothetical protein